MTNDRNNLTPARTVAPRARAAANPRANPAARPSPREAVPVEAELEISIEIEAEELANDQLTLETATTPVIPATDVPATSVPVVPAAQQADQEPAPQPGPEPDFPKTVKTTLKRVDEAWAAFRAAAGRYPSERMDDRIGEDGWTRKQMLEHVAAWHDLTADRLVKMYSTGASVPLDRDTDQFNAAIARQAVGKTSGEIIKDLDATFNRLRRQMARMTDAQLKNDEWWAAWVIGGNTYGHYEEHWADIYTPELSTGTRPRR